MAKTTAKFKDTLASYSSIVSNIKAQKFSSLYLLMGDVGYFIDSVCDMLSQSLLPEEHRAFNQIVVYGRDADAGQVTNYCRQMPMMGQRQVVIVKEAQNLKQIEKLSHYAAQPSPTTVLVICHKEKNLDKRSALYKSILKTGVVMESIRPRDYEIGGWLSSFVGSRGLKISNKSLSMLVDNLGADISKISNELTKLMLSLPAETKTIEDIHIEQNIGISKDFNNFELNRAIVNRDTARALFIADHFAHNPKANPLLLTIISMFGEFKRLFTLNYLVWLVRQKGERMPSDMELMRILKCGNPFAVAELKQVLPLWHNTKVFAVLGLLREYDGKSKGINSGGASDGELLRELLLKIFNA